MTGSASEERIRAKTVAMMRLRWPEARIIHELPLSSGVIRIDVAAVGPDFLAVAEIKSELDVLKRLESQLELSVAVADEVWLCSAVKHEEAIEAAQSWRGGEDRALYRLLRQTRTFYERSHADPYLTPSRNALLAWPTWPDPRKRFQMLWAAEMSRVLLPLGGAHGNMATKARNAVEWMSGGDIRKGVCRELRNRPMARADDPIGARLGDALSEPQLELGQ